MQSYICIYICISTFTRIRTYRASRFPETHKKNQKDRRLWRKEDKLSKTNLVSQGGKRMPFTVSCHMSMPCRNLIINTIKDYRRSRTSSTKEFPHRYTQGVSSHKRVHLRTHKICKDTL